ncbi:glycosyltransferase family 2 protein [Nonlabens sp. Ci31]|uniref:glycosyltransferase family 2 protein n=1 Tax=Nonlabens sp. Ci31 TaxID=2608253 RepID=UPI0014644B4E|nr:glycosyltransferase family 2 protein [Nonlabens sp. Ci31]QJP32994.1 glycosyltransferase family 2 protein [Nonlabens sp. Ci31]
MSFAVSVIIPVYNADQFIEKAIDSALMFTEVNEVVVINDGSTDSSLELLLKLQEKDARIKIYHHKGAVNRGRSASRNLGILQAKSDYISFLDADDFYLEQRFNRDKLLLRNQHIDGVYNAVGFHLYRGISDTEYHHFKVATLSQIIPPEVLFENIVSSRLGYLHLNGLTVKRRAFDIVGFFNEELIVAEDSDLIFKMALRMRLVPGYLQKEVSKRGVHITNIFTNDALYEDYNLRLYESLITWSLRYGIQKEKIALLLDTLWIHRYRQKASILTYVIYWMQLQKKWPQLMVTRLFLKYFPLVRLRQRLFPIIFKKGYQIND